MLKAELNQRNFVLPPPIALMLTYNILYEIILLLLLLLPLNLSLEHLTWFLEQDDF